MVTAIPKTIIQKNNREKRNIKPTHYYETRNIVERYQTDTTRSFKIPEGRNTQQYKNSFFVRPVIEFG